MALGDREGLFDLVCGSQKIDTKVAGFGISTTVYTTLKVGVIPLVQAAGSAFVNTHRIRVSTFLGRTHENLLNF